MTLNVDKPEIGIYANVPFEEYLKIRAVNHSTLKTVRRSAKQYKYHLTAPATESASKLLGTAVHMALFEPELFRQRIMSPPINPATGKAFGFDTKAYQECLKKNPGKLVVSDEDLDRINSMVEEIMSNPTAAPLFKEPGVSEEVMIWRDKGLGVLCKARVDRRVLGICRLDLKTSEDISEDGFGKSVVDYGYHTAEAFYLRGVRALCLAETDQVLIAVQNEPAYDCVVYGIPEELRVIGDKLVTEWVAKVAACQKRDEWPGVQQEPGVIPIKAPAWYLQRFQDNEI